MPWLGQQLQPFRAAAPKTCHFARRAGKAVGREQDAAAPRGLLLRCCSCSRAGKAVDGFMIFLRRPVCAWIRLLRWLRAPKSALRVKWESIEKRPYSRPWTTRFAPASPTTFASQAGQRHRLVHQARCPVARRAPITAAGHRLQAPVQARPDPAAGCRAGCVPPANWQAESGTHVPQPTRSVGITNRNSSGKNWGAKTSLRWGVFEGRRTAPFLRPSLLGK